MKKQVSFIIKKPDLNLKVNLKNKKIIINNDKQKIEFLFNNKLLLKSQVNFFRNKIKNSFISLTHGWTVELLLKGIGYKSFYINKLLILDLGYSNLITYKIPDTISVWNLKTKLFFYSIDKSLLNNVVYQIKKFSLPEAYTGKGILFHNEIIKLKTKKVR